MHLRSTFLSSLLFAAAALAHPFEHSSLSSSLVKRATNASNIYAGVSLNSPKNTNFKSVDSFIVIPQLSSTVEMAGVGFWTSIGLSCPNNYIMVGVTCQAHADGSFTCIAVSRLPEGIQPYNDITIQLGETVGLAITLTTATTGTIYITNADGTSANQFTSTQEICQTDTQWMLQAMTTQDDPSTFPKFTNATFQWAVATDANGQSHAPSGSLSYGDIVLGGVTLTSTYIEGASVIIDHL